MHRIRDVRLGKRVDIGTLAEQMGTDVPSLQVQEQELTDLWVSDLLRWREALDVPLSELVVDEGAPLGRPPLERPQLVRLVETAVAIHSQTPVIDIRRMARMLVDQLVEMMPELSSLSPWQGQDGDRLIEEEEVADMAGDELRGDE
jgi:hypothetical protein